MHVSLVTDAADQWPHRSPKIHVGQRPSARGAVEGRGALAQRRRSRLPFTASTTVAARGLLVGAWLARVGALNGANQQPSRPLDRVAPLAMTGARRPTLGGHAAETPSSQGDRVAIVRRPRGRFSASTPSGSPRLVGAAIGFPGIFGDQRGRSTAASVTKDTWRPTAIGARSCQGSRSDREAACPLQRARRWRRGGCWLAHGSHAWAR